MVILKKIKGSTLIETLVASVLIVVIFMMASMILNNIFLNAVRNDSKAIESHITELEYLYKNEKLILPIYDTFQSWDVSVEKVKTSQGDFISFEAIKQNTNLNYSRQIHASQ